MEKMMKPEVEAVRFGEVDVIATSGLTGGQYYAALKDEYKEYYPDWDGQNGWVLFDRDTLPDEAHDTSYDSIANQANYAWYDNGWKTENKLVSSYSPNFPE